jgi:O-antigen/teichoic acid export membrane protein
MSSVIMLVFLISKESLGFLAPKQYIENVFIILPLLLYAELKLSDQFLSSVLNARRVYKPTVIANLCFSLFSVSSLLLLLPTIGLFAAGTGLILGTAASLIYKLYSISKIGISAITANDIFSPTLICLVFGAVALSLSNHPEIRLLLAIYPAIKLLNLYFGDIKGDKTELKLN